MRDHVFHKVLFVELQVDDVIGSAEFCQATQGISESTRYFASSLDCLDSDKQTGFFVPFSKFLSKHMDLANSLSKSLSESGG